MSTDINKYQHAEYKRSSFGHHIITLIRAVTPVTSPIWGAKVNTTFLGWTHSEDAARIYAEEWATTQLGNKTDKQSMIETLNALRAERGMPPLAAIAVKELKLTKSKIDQLLYELDTPAFDVRVKAEVETTAQLLAKYNAIRAKHDMVKIIAWKSSRSKLELAIAELQKKAPPGVEVKKCKEAIAEGANTQRYHTAMHKNKIHKAVLSQNKKDDRSKLKSQNELAADIAQQAGFTKATCLAFVQIKGYVAKKDLPPEGVVEAIREWIKKRDVAMPSKKKAAKTPRKQKASDSITPQNIADATGKDARAVRIILRKIEAKIPKAWRVADERWGFKPQHQADIMKMIKGGK